MPLRNLWAKPQVHILFNNYTLSFTIRDINRALQLLTEAGDSTFGITSRLDTNKKYTIELLPDIRTLYHDQLQVMMQNAVATYLLTAKRALITNPKQKTISTIELEIITPETGENYIYLNVYDPKTKAKIFTGKMPINLYDMDIGIDYW